MAENRTPQARVRTRESPRPAVRNRSREIDAVSDARPVDLLVYSLAWLLTCLVTYLLGHLGVQATTTLTATPCRCGRNVARPSSSKTKVPPGLMA